MGVLVQDGAFLSCTLPAHPAHDPAQACLPRKSVEYCSSSSSPMDAIDAVPSGIPFSQWLEANDLGRSTGYGLLALVEQMGIAPSRMRIGNASKPSVVLDGQCLDAMERLLARFKAGTSLKQLQAEMEAATTTAIAAPVPTAIVADDHQGEVAKSGKHDPDDLLKRLQAAKLAAETGLPLSRSELTWILGAGPTTDIAQQSSMDFHQHCRHGWTITKSG